MFHNCSLSLTICTPDVTRTHNLRLRRTLIALEYQSLTGSSDLRVTIICPGLSRNADFDTLPLNQLQVDKVSHVSPFNSDASRSYFILKNFFDWQIK